MSAIGMNVVPIKITLENSLITRMLAYSAIKIRANIPLLYSTLKPDTSSDSPSAKSKGVRLVSAKFVMNHTTARGINIAKGQEFEWALIKSIEVITIRAVSSTRDMLTSYEMVCATPRKAPRRAYFEFDLHPARKVVYTFMLDTHKKYRILY